MLNFPAHKVFPLNMFKRLYSHYSLLDGRAVPQLITDCGPLYCLHATSQLSLFDSTACINFLLTEAYQRDIAGRYELQV
jgi:hypothetical protein